MKILVIIDRSVPRNDGVKLRKARVEARKYYFIVPSPCISYTRALLDVHKDQVILFRAAIISDWSYT